MIFAGMESMFSQLWQWRSPKAVESKQDAQLTNTTPPPAPSSQLLTLPNELILEISTHLTTPKDLLSLLLTTRAFPPLLQPILTTYAFSSPTYPGALQTAARTSNLPLVHTLLRTIPVNDGIARTLETPLHHALKAPTHRRTQFTTTIVALLIFHGADISARAPAAITPLHYAAFHNLPECAALLLSAGADPNAADAFGRTPLHCAAASGASSVVRILLQHGADARVRDRYYRLPVSYGNAYYRLGCTAQLYKAMGEKWAYPPRVQMRCLVLDTLLGWVFRCRGRVGFGLVLGLVVLWVIPAVLLVAVGRALRVDRAWMLGRWALGLGAGPEWGEYGVRGKEMEEDED
ncbi:ankyrin [Morchella conica CCBAS932]|uniref:Ankyrin n=1 Tax=Morchella conica CCBAS932 TaxID=1392247 RepID=A0A3N4LHE4_9PEZI|nr:ankyrin [Morchella conica CCBAS932]